MYRRRPTAVLMCTGKPAPRGDVQKGRNALSSMQDKTPEKPPETLFFCVYHDQSLNLSASAREPMFLRRPRSYDCHNPTIFVRRHQWSGVNVRGTVRTRQCFDTKVGSMRQPASPKLSCSLGLTPVPAAIMMTLRWAGGGASFSMRNGPCSWTVGLSES